jgi:hypothetical protein
LRSSFPEPCNEGSYQPSVQTNACIPCPIGYYCPDRKLSSPVLCESGKMCTKTGLIVPDTNCTPGFFCGKGVMAEADVLNPSTFIDYDEKIHRNTNSSFTLTKPVICPIGELSISPFLGFLGSGCFTTKI